MTGPLEPLPSTWVSAMISDIADVNPKLDKAEIPDDLEVSFVPMPAVEELTGRIDLTTSRRFSEVKKGYTAFQEGDVLFAKITPCMENGKMAIVPAVKNRHGFGSTEFHVLRPFVGIEAKYLYYFVSSERFRAHAEHHMTGAVGQRRVATSYLSEQRIPIAPPEEQRRIVAKIEELFCEIGKGVEALVTAQEQLNLYRQVILNRAFDKGLAAPTRNALSDGQAVSIEAIAEKIVDCLHSTPKFAKTGKYCVDSTWIEDNKLLRNQARFVNEATYEDRIRRLKPTKGDVLLVREGSKKIGTCLVVDFDDEFCLGQRMMMFRLRPDILPRYFAYYIQSDGFKRQYKPLIGGTASPHLNISDIRRMKLPLFSIRDQAGIVSAIDAQFTVFDDVNHVITSEISKSKALRQAVLARAFSGRLVRQDPKDEPFRAFVERIRTECEGETRNTERNEKNGKKKAA
jgi:type I restriction enzyme, S subunit